MRIVEVQGRGPLLDTVYGETLAPAFPPAELVTVESLAEGLDRGDTSVFAIVDEHGRPRAAAVGDWFADSDVVLLSYLAARRDERSRGLGGRLLSQVLASWQQRWQPCLVVAEIEHPSAHAGSTAHGEPAARVRFYARHGVRPLDLPYFQPALRPDLTRVYGLMLCVLALAEGCRGNEPETVDGSRLRGWLVEYLTGSEGALGTDSATLALLRATQRAGGVRLLSFDEIDAVPCATAPAP